jgi:hypothetical protein
VRLGSASSCSQRDGLNWQWHRAYRDGDEVL